MNDDHPPEDGKQQTVAETVVERVNSLNKNKNDDDTTSDERQQTPEIKYIYEELGKSETKKGYKVNKQTKKGYKVNKQAMEDYQVNKPVNNSTESIRWRNMKHQTDLPSSGLQSNLDTDPPSYDVAVANKCADLYLTLHSDVSRVVDTTGRIEQTSNVTMKGLSELGLQFKMDTIYSSQRQAKQHRDVQCSLEKLNTKLDTVLRRIPELWDDSDEELDLTTMQRQPIESDAIEDGVGLDDNTRDNSCIYHCKRCRRRRQCTCLCHRGHRRKTTDKEMEQEKVNLKEFPGGMSDLQSSTDAAHGAYRKERSRGRERQRVGACGGTPGGSSDNISDSSEDDTKREREWSGRKRNKDKSKWNRGDKPDSRDNAEQHNDLMNRLETFRKLRQRRVNYESSQAVGACGGNPGGSHDDPSDDSDDSMDRGKKWQGRRQEQKKGKTTWTIDSIAWTACIDSGNTDSVVALLSQKKLPDNTLLNDARKTFEAEFICLICDEICKYILQKSKDITYVYPATMRNEGTEERDACNITFVVILAYDTDLGNEFKFHKMNTTDGPYPENTDIMRREKETCVLENVSDPEAAMLIQCIQKHSKSLLKQHTNLCRISKSGFLSSKFGKVNCCVKQGPCITLYVYAKGLIPLGENVLPTNLDIEDRSVLVDVREGFVEVYTGNQGPCDTLDNLRMGCSIGVEPRENEALLNGTLGGFFEIGGTDFCISTAHVFLSANEMERLRTKETPILERSDSAKPVYQPHDNYLIPFGKGRTAVYTEGGNGQTGVDVISILIENRSPNTGEFPTMDGDDEADKEYRHGKVYNREEIDNALKADRNRCIYKYGCGTGWTTSIFRTDGALFRAPHPLQDGNTDFDICLHNQFEIYNDADNEFAGKSDSGALVFMEDNDELVAIGMVVAGMPGEVCFVTPLDEILKTLKVDQKNGLKKFTSRNDPIETDDLSFNQDSDTVNVDLTELQDKMSNVETEVDFIKGNMTEMQSDISDVKIGMGDMKKEMKNVKDEVKDVKDEVKDLKDEVKGGFAEILKQLQNNQHNQNS